MRIVETFGSFPYVSFHLGFLPIQCPSQLRCCVLTSLRPQLRLKTLPPLGGNWRRAIRLRVIPPPLAAHFLVLTMAFVWVGLATLAYSLYRGDSARVHVSSRGFPSASPKVDNQNSRLSFPCIRLGCRREVTKLGSWFQPISPSANWISCSILMMAVGEPCLRRDTLVLYYPPCSRSAKSWISNTIFIIKQYKR